MKTKQVYAAQYSKDASYFNVGSFSTRKQTKTTYNFFNICFLFLFNRIRIHQNYKFFYLLYIFYDHNSSRMLFAVCAFSRHLIHWLTTIPDAISSLSVVIPICSRWYWPTLECASSSIPSWRLTMLPDIRRQQVILMLIRSRWGCCCELGYRSHPHPVSAYNNNMENMVMHFALTIFRNKLGVSKYMYRRYLSRNNFASI